MRQVMNTPRDIARRSIIALVVVAVSAISGAGSAYAGEVFAVRGVPVDATANEAAEARVIAIRQGRHTALRILFQRLTQQADWPLLPMLETSEVTVMGAGFEVSGERNSPTRYLARITYRFKPDEVRRVLRENDIPFSEAQARPMVVLPVFVRGNEMLIWEEESPWREAWAGRNYTNELVSITTPLGDLGDVMVTPTDAVTSFDYFELASFADRYGVQDILLAVVSQTEETAPISLEIYRLNPTSTDSFTMLLPVADNIQSSFEFAIDSVVEKLQEDWKAKTIIRYGDQRPMTVSAEFQSMSEWLLIRTAIEATPNIVDSNLVALSTGGAQMTWSVVGTPEQLALALNQYSVTLAPSGMSRTEPTNPALALEEVRLPPRRQGELPPTRHQPGDAYDPTVERRSGSGSFFDLLDDTILSTPANSQPDYWIVRHRPQMVVSPTSDDEDLDDMVVDFDTETTNPEDY